MIAASPGQHVSVKCKIGAGALAANILAKKGFEPALAWAYVTMFIELVSGGLPDHRPVHAIIAAVLAIEILIALLFVHLAKGCAAGSGGYKYVLLIGTVYFLIAIRGGGPYSVDRPSVKRPNREMEHVTSFGLPATKSEVCPLSPHVPKRQIRRSKIAALQKDSKMHFSSAARCAEVQYLAGTCPRMLEFKAP